MENLILSIQERCNNLFKEAFSICYEDNPLRIGWDLHKIDCNVTITKEKYRKPDAYYLIEVYLPEQLTNNLFSIVEGFTAWLETYINGRTSIYNLLNEYTPEKLENILIKHENSLKEISEARQQFILSNKA